MSHIFPVFERQYPGKQMLCVFNNSSNHGAYAEDALIASRMGKNPGELISA